MNPWLIVGGVVVVAGAALWVVLASRRSGGPGSAATPPRPSAARPTGAPVDVPVLARAVAAVGLDPKGLRSFGGVVPPEIVEIDVDAKRSVPLRDALRESLRAEGWYPVVVRDEHGNLEETYAAQREKTPALILEEAKGIDVAAWLKARVAAEPEPYGSVERGEWGRGDEAAGFTVPTDVLTGKPAPGVRIAFVPVREGWEVPAWFRFGDWNECPSPAAHAAIHRTWAERFGAEIVCLSGDVIEARVERPPTDRPAAEALAHDQFVYTGGDLVFQGTQTLRALASTLLGGKTWFFWWD